MMSQIRSLEILDYHVAGEPLRIILPLSAIAGATMAEKAEKAMSLLHDERCLATAEPRGHRDIFAAFLTDSISPDAHFGALFCDGEIDSPFKGTCGHGAIALAAAALNEGWITPVNGPNIVHIDVPAGRVSLSVDWSNGSAGEITYRHVPSRLLASEQVYATALGPVSGALVAAGPQVLLVDAAKHNIEPDQHAAYVHYRAIQCGAEEAGLAMPDLVQFRWKEEGRLDFRSVTFFGQASFDRSPCGTATSALVTYLASTGGMTAQDMLCNRTLWGTSFKAGVAATDESFPVADMIRPKIRARAFATGRSRLLLDRDDALTRGLPLFTLT